jgi:hypothetical protein
LKREQIDELGWALKDPYSKHLIWINEQIDALIRTDDESLQQIGSELRPYLI